MTLISINVHKNEQNEDKKKILNIMVEPLSRFCTPVKIPQKLSNRNLFQFPNLQNMKNHRQFDIEAYLFFNWLKLFEYHDYCYCFLLLIT